MELHCSSLERMGRLDMRFLIVAVSMKLIEEDLCLFVYLKN